VADFQQPRKRFAIWKELFAAVDGRLRIVNVIQPFGSVMSVMEVMLDS